MKNNGITVFLIAIAAIIIAVIVFEFVSKRPGQQPANPYEYEIDQLKKVDSTLIIYREIRNFNLTFEKPAGIAWLPGKLFVVGDKKLIAINLIGKLLLDIALAETPTCVAANHENIFVASEKSVMVLDSVGTVIAKWSGFNEKCIITSMFVHTDRIYIADAGNRKVYRYSLSGNKELEFEGKVNETSSHGFILPSAVFDLAIDSFGDLWVVNPGKHALENYTADGVLRGWWSPPGTGVESFYGCCNPAQFTFLPNGNFITSEKGVVRIKEYKPSGEFVGIVAPPSKFVDDGHAPDVVADADGRIYALDLDRNRIRVFERNQ